MATIKHKVVRGDTLSALAVKYKTTVSSIAKLNNIKNVNRIYVGQVLYISGKPSSSSSSSGSSSTSSGGSKPSNTVSITSFGLQADSDRTIFAIWKWNKSNTKEYQVIWQYYTKNGVWFEGSNTTETIKESVYNAPSNATKVRVKIKPISKTYTKNKKEVNYWTASWSSYKTYDMNNLPPNEPPTPTVEVEDYKLTCRLDNLDVNATEIEFNIVKNDKTSFKTSKVKIVTSSASYSCTINAGDEYKVRARAKRGNSYSAWSDYSAAVSTKPIAPSEITRCEATSKTSILVAWNKVVTAKTYEIEYTTKKEYFDGSNATTKIGSIETTQYEITGLASGERYFFRVRAINDKGESAWTSIKSVVIGTKPEAPTTWSSSTTVISGERLILYWVHNSEDESKETSAQIELYVNDVKSTINVPNNTTEDDDKNKTRQYIITTNDLTEGVVIKWRVRTAGITNEYGEWSVQRTVNVYAPPTITLQLLDKEGAALDTLESFPFYISAVSGPATQKPVSYHLSIVSNSSYETVDEVGNVKMVLEGDEVYSKVFDISTNLMLEMTPGSVDLQNNVDYIVTCTVSMDSGLNKTETERFTVAWIDETFIPNAEMILDKETISINIRPYCEYYPEVYYKVNYADGKYTRTSTVIDKIEGTSIDDAFTEEDDIVYSGLYQGVLTMFCIVTSETPTLIEDISLSVYRREFDGKFTEIGKGLKNIDNTFITDPHPALDYARYRIVAISNSTGSVSFTDLPGYPVDEKAIVIQWDEQWSEFDLTDEEPVEEPPWAGSLLKLPYNIDVSDSNNNDVTLVNYIGRSHPVSYYGTQVGSTATWNVDIPKDDIDTLYALRRLAIYLGDVYVREPSGTGYWANLSLSFSKTHNEMVIPVTMSLTRVEGGV